MLNDKNHPYYNNYIFNGDINSQYPASMAGCLLMSVLYPCGDVESVENDIELCTKTFNQSTLESKIFHVFQLTRSRKPNGEWSVTRIFKS